MSDHRKPRFALPRGARIKSLENIREACDSVIDDGGTWPSPEMLQNPRPLDAALPYLADSADGDVVYVKSNMMDCFFERAFSLIKSRITLVTAGEDTPTPGAHRHRLDDPRIAKWFGQNCDLTEEHPKFVRLPIGITDAHIPWGDQEVLLDTHRRLPDIEHKPDQVYANFHLSMSHPERLAALLLLKESPLVTFETSRLPPELIWRRHADFAFEISPPGNGLDCHRTWEALLLRTIPIVMNSTLIPMFEQFPIVIVSSWTEITAENLARWRQRLADSFTLDMFHRLTRDYWLERIGCPLDES